MAGILYVVATPIGNLEDITLRALEVLRASSLVACEDTRRTRRLLNRHGIEARCMSYHRFNEKSAAEAVLDRLRSGRDVALVSDAGTPLISDPGRVLISRAIDSGLAVRPVPGPSAAVAALSASGLDASVFTFRGFLPHRRGERSRVLKAIAREETVQVFYESPRRVASCLKDMAEILGPRRCCVVREMTKRFEQWHRGTLPEVASALEEAAQRGEFCILVEGRPAGEERRAGTGEGSLAAEYRELIATGCDRRGAIKKLAKSRGLSRSEIYRRLTAERPSGSGE